ncbi:phytoene/squalene synthase family protein [Candidatus Bipolaricaulota bacterium]|nr:phytoene/squalene synthase family protein [Candidatus Bipolaricaulota bacterium]
MKSQPEGVVREDESPESYCKRITRDRAKNFYWAILTLPKDKRSAVYTIYTFARRCDDIADSSWDVSRKKDHLEQERENLKSLYEGNPRGKLYEALGRTVEKYDIPRTYFDQLIQGVEMDLTKERYSTFKDLKVYCFRVASVVGLALIEIFGYDDDKAKKHAIDLGLGMQMTNIIRDVAEDYSRGRIYIPEEDLAKFNCDFSRVDSNGVDAQFRELMDYEAVRAREFFRSGKKLFAYLTPRTRACPAGLYGIYSKLLEKMESSGWQVWDQRTRLNTVRKVSAVLGQWLSSLSR